MAKLEIDSNGFPILLADVPDSGGVVTRKTGADGGNPQHDSRSGKFAPGSSQGDPVSNIPANTDPNAYLRQMDAIRDLAREMDDLDAGDVQDYLAARVTRPLEETEIQELLVLIRQQRINDLVDMLDYQLRGLIDGIKRGRRKVKVSAPKGWMRKTFNSITDDEFLSVINRLEARGHKREDLQRSVLSRIKKQERRDAIGQRLAELPEQGEGLDLSFNEFSFDDDYQSYDDNEHLTELLQSMKDKSEQPIIVNVNVENKPTRKIIKRDSKTGLVETIEEIKE